MTLLLKQFSAFADEREPWRVKDVEEARDTMLESAQAVAPAPKLLLKLKGIGPEFAAVLWSEGLSRQFDNRRQVAAYAGLAPTP